MLKFEPGTLVRSLAGHDKGKLYIIIEERYPMLLLADGALRTMEKPKSKKVMHIQLIHETPMSHNRSWPIFSRRN